MRETLNLKKDLEFNNNIAEITSISLECNYEVDNNNINGVFLVDGSFRSHEISLNQAEFNFKIPFEYTYQDNIISDSANVNIKDFTYTIEANTLCVDIEYEVVGEIDDKEDYLDEEEFDRFLAEHEVEVVDLTNKEEEIKEEEILEETILPALDHLDDEPNISLIPESDCEEDTRDLTSSLMDNITGTDTYITYHVYVCTDNDSLESIANNFNISLDVLKNYNSIDAISAGVKLIIPADE